MGQNAKLGSGTKLPKPTLSNYSTVTADTVNKHFIVLLQWTFVLDFHYF